ncbi:MAG: radical SAM family heme chaperone HemW [Pseudomonadota bacterium]
MGAFRKGGALGERGAPHARQDWEAGGFGLYIHWPFCLAKCPYCDFNSHVAKSAIDHALWARALEAEMAAMRALTGPRRLDTVFFGGGTPSLMAPTTVARLLEAADRHWGLAPAAEVTLEANPTSVEAARFAAFRAAGVNRVSVGVQALDDASLKALGRTHSVAEARTALAIARERFERVSFDLIYARMGQTPSAWEAELGEALSLAADHLSLYQLTIEPGTRFAELHARGRLRVPEDAPSAEMYEITQDMTAAAGLPAYEVSNHAAPGAESRHNLVYWRYGDYAGIGPGAHGRLTLADGRRLATETLRDPAEWLAAVRAGREPAVRENLTPADQAVEMVLMGLRLDEGVDPERYAALAGRPLGAETLAALGRDGLIETVGGRLRTTDRGRLVLDRVLGTLLD